MDEQSRFLILIAERLDLVGLPYMITGSFAMAIYSRPRMTRDIDLVVEVDLADVDKLVGLFKGDCYIDRDAVAGAVSHSSMFNVIHKKWTAKADFIVRKDAEYRRVEFARRRKMPFANGEINIVSIEDLILSKLVWRKQSQSEQQLSDVRLLMLSTPQLDRDYMKKWAIELGVEETLAAMENDG